MGLKLFSGRQGFQRNAENRKKSSGDGLANWDKEITLRKNDMRVKFLFLNELETEEEGEKLFQFYEHRFVAGTTNKGKPMKTNIPCDGDESCPVVDEHGNHAKDSYRWASNILILAVEKRGGDGWVACELETDPQTKELKPLDAEKGPWHKRPMQERVRILTQGGDTENDLIFSWEKDSRLGPVKKGDKYECRPYFIRRFQGSQRVEYKLDSDDKKPAPATLIEPALEARYNLREFLEDRQDFGLKVAGYRKWATKKTEDGGDASPEPSQTSAPAEAQVSDDDLADFTPLTENDFNDDTGDSDLIG